jgi:outer membrane protein OmpA-like peptidoglycan-associated protein/tetratricopeptide (TPR) repeat protein
MYKIRKYIFFIFSFFTTFIFAQTSPKALLKEAEMYYDAQKYDKALENYFQLQRLSPLSDNIQIHLAICYYQVGNIKESLKYLNYIVVNNKKVDPVVLLCMARCLHENLEFKEAIGWYKKYLAAAKKSAKEREGVKDDIKRCAIGLKSKHLESENFVQNLGEGVNSTGDDFAPILSPNSSEKIYFSSARATSFGGMRDAEGMRDEKMGTFSSDIFSAEIENGEWGSARPLSYLLNGPRHDVALDFSQNGQMMYYYRGYNLFSGDIFVDTFKTFDKRTLKTVPFRSQINANDGDGTPYLFNDTLMFFSSRRAGGYGGADLYYSIFQGERWQKARNLGAIINSPYDDVCPFLTNDGRTLFFSSNNTNSIGGLDIFKSTFIDDSLQWTVPVNLETPINSPGDDAFFRLTDDGSKGFFSSHRKDGFGQRDIYSVFFKNAIEAQTDVSKPDLFFKVTPKNGQVVSADNSSKVEPVVTYTISALSYDKDADILSAKNQKTLAAMLAILRKNVATRIRIVVHSDDNAGGALDAFFTIKRAEKTAEYLIKEGIAADRIELLGCGAAYPVALNILEGSPSAVGQRFNRRIEPFFAKKDKFIQLETSEVEIPDYLQSGEFFRFKNLNKGLSYRVRIASIKQMYSGDILSRYPDLMIEKNASENVYHYTLGLFGSFAQAERLQKDLLLQGIEVAKVLPYVEGWQIKTDDEVKNNVAQYSDLQFFINRKK